MLVVCLPSFASNAAASLNPVVPYRQLRPYAARKRLPAYRLPARSRTCNGALEQYWKPIREKREGAGRRSGTLHLAPAQSNRGRRGRKRDFPDAERLVKRLVARELTLSFVPDAEQRLWRTVTRRKYQLTRDHVRLQNQLESLLEEAHIKLSSLVSNLLGASARRMMKALADGETNPAALAVLADKQLRATPEQLCDVLGACTDLKSVHRRLLWRTAIESQRWISTGS